MFNSTFAVMVYGDFFPESLLFFLPLRPKVVMCIFFHIHAKILIHGTTQEYQIGKNNTYDLGPLI